MATYGIILQMYKPQFDYMPLSRATVEGKRLYSTPDGKKLPSVTTILDATKPIQNIQSLQKWRNWVGHEKATAITTEASNRGTRMHTYLEKFILEGAIPERGDNPFSWSSHAMAEVMVRDGLKNVSEIWGVEVNLYFPSLYAGTTDGVGLYKGTPAILDYKQTNKPKKKEWIDDYFLQLVAYILAHNELYGTNIDTGVILMCVKPEIDDKFNVISPPKYQEFVLDSEDFKKYEQEWWKRLELYYLSA